MSEDLTPRQARLLQYLQQTIARKTKAPSLRQAAADLGVSHTAVAQMLNTLAEKGHIERPERYSRTIHLLNRPAAAALQRGRQVPVIGRITAGLPMYAQQQWEDTIVVDGAMFRGRNLFALRVQGDSMKDAAILDGDVAVCEPRQYACNGEIVVALIHGEEATVKRFFMGPDYIELRPENPAYAPVRYQFDDILVQGRVVGIVRTAERL